MAQKTQEELLQELVAKIDGVAINPTTESSYYYNGQYCNYNMDVTELKGLLDVLG